tara:strand:+ start:114 stop:320 length:207 start_codon:yes stop_codon:yes gene_type:complete
MRMVTFFKKRRKKRKDFQDFQKKEAEMFSIYYYLKLIEPYESKENIKIIEQKFEKILKKYLRGYNNKT